MRPLPDWAEWNPAAADSPWTVGIEEEVMLVDPVSGELCSRVDDVIAAAPDWLARCLTRETHDSAVELATGAHPDAAAALRELRAHRAALADVLHGLGLAPAAAGTHPIATWRDAGVTDGERQREIHHEMHGLARREPTFALHVHVAVPDPDAATRAMNRTRAHVPLLLALSANSPFWQGRDSGLASTRTTLFDVFPRTGLPRAFDGYHDLVVSSDLLIRAGAIRDPSFIWWDLRLQPRYGTLEVRVMDAQTDAAAATTLAALVVALVRAEAEEQGVAAPALVGNPEVLHENRFLALRDGVAARFIDPDRAALVGVDDVLARTLAAVGPVAGVDDLLADPAAERQREIARGGDGIAGVVPELIARFLAPAGGE